MNGTDSEEAAVHKDPVWRDRSNFIIQAELPERDQSRRFEQLFAKLKALLRKAAERSVEGLWNRIACLLDAFTPDECVNCFRNAGYASS